MAFHIYVTGINHAWHFAWQAQYLGMLEVSAVAPRDVNDVSHVSRINHESHFCVAGEAFGDVGVSLFVAGAAFGDVPVSLFVAGAAFGMYM